MGDHREVEWQFDATGLEAVTRWLEESGSRGALTVVSEGERELTDTYYDTAGWRIFRAGYAVRVRRFGDGGAEATMKALTPGDGSGLRRRREISEPLDGGLRKGVGPVGERVGNLAGPRGLRPLFEARTRRRVYALRRGDVRFGEVVLDETRVISPGGGVAAEMSRVEVETEDDALPVIEPFVRDLREGCCLEPAMASKFRVGLSAVGLEAPGPPEFGPRVFGMDSTAGEAAFAVLRVHFARFLSHEGGVRLGEDPEELHDMRVAGRRVRAAIRIFDRALPVRLRAMEEDIRWILDFLGEVRDLDVQLERLKELSPDGFREVEGAISELRGVLERRREKARSELLRALNSRRYARFVETFADLLRAGPTSSVAARRPLLEVAPEILKALYRRVCRAQERLGAGPSAGDHHRLRRRVRRLRYALEFFVPVYGGPARKYLRRLKEVQDVLGEHQDAVVCARQMRGIPASRGGDLLPQTLFVAGYVACSCDRRAGELRGALPETLGRLAGGRWKRLVRKMEKMQRAGGVG
ncbi:CHAD domain-containing protein [Rubrobacter calidifluminis]|uniref:CYTH and CHAD domain-containing protein n=1 Tax=Rubrobacter calidifluminis TaxID=1392640 RepID=UPI00235FEBB9|nr:CHAD domain-containing protein [Rubrobacter calidifluminis]